MSRAPKEILSAQRLQRNNTTLNQQLSSLSEVISVGPQPQPPQPRRRSDLPASTNNSTAPLSPSMSEEQKMDHYITILKDKLQKQKSELDTRTDNVNAIQRNFERLSEMYANDRNNWQSAQMTIDKLTKENEDLRAQLKVNNVVRQEFTALQQKFEKLEKLHAAESAATGQEILALRKYREATEDEKRKLSETNISMRAQLAELEAQERHSHDELKSAERSVNQLLDQILLVHQSVELVPPLRGDGISFIRRDVSDVDSSTMSVSSRIITMRNSLSLAGSRAIPPVLSKVESIKSTHNSQHVLLQNELLQSKKSFSETSMALHMAQSRVEDLERALAEAGGKINNAQKVSSERAAMEALRASSLESQLVNVQSQLSEVTERFQATERALLASQQEIKGVTGMVNDLRAMVQTKDEEIEKSRSEIVNLRQSYDRLSKEKDVSGNTWIQRQKDWEDQAKIHAVREAQRKREREEEAKRMAELAQEATQLKQQIQSVRNELSLSMQSKDELQNKLDSALADIQRCRSDVDMWKDKFNNCVSELQNAQGVLDTASQRNQDTEAMRLRSEKENGSLKSEIAELKIQIQEGNRLYEVYKQLSEKEGSRVKLLDGQLDTWKQRALGAEKDLTTAVQEKDELSVALHVAKQRLDFAKSEEAMAKSLLKRFEHEKETLYQEKELNAKLLASLRTMQEESTKTVKKLLQAEEACESNYSCMACMALMRDPVICAPCGHSYCRQCLATQQQKRGNQYCVECDKNNVQGVVPSKALDLLSGKYLYRKQVLNDLLSVLHKETRRSSVSVSE
eukprot:PhF_6_TR14917/c0_g1_i1/m.23310